MTTTSGKPATIERPATSEQPATSENVGNYDVAQAAARDVARLLDRRGLRDIVELARRVLRESARGLAPTAGPRPSDDPGGVCTLRQHERSTRRGTAGRATDDDRT